MARLLVLCVVVLALTACSASSGAPRAQRSEFEDIPVPAGLTLDNSRTTIIESPTVKAARLFYKSRVKPDSLAVAYRTSLEANGWRHVSSTTSANNGTIQVYEKPDSSLQVMIYESWYYTWSEVSATRIVARPSTAAPSR
ncbi:MAG TPA: hypothetical protein VKN16_06880 [Methylomirabilota bacterium]|jgi:hypothetical protein|nr:hypothetical protein [Methylomirabilota bacterium]